MTLEILSDIHDHDNFIAEGTASTVVRVNALLDDEPKTVVVKSSSFDKKFAPEPHDIMKEVHILSEAAHENIVSLLAYEEDEQEPTARIYLEFVPVSLTDLLDSPHFSPHAFRPESGSDPARFVSLAKWIMRGILAGLAYLHERGIAHRDVKPGNVHLTRNGVVKLIDFGVSWHPPVPNPVWPESPDRMYFEVSSGAYRAPELLFGTRFYDAQAIDIWSAGAVFAEFFTSLVLESQDDDEDDLAHGQDVSAPFVVPLNLRIGQPYTSWRRRSLLNGTRGEIGLAWSIFKLRGTPDESSWPDFKDLPDARSVEFTRVPAVKLSTVLLNLPSSSLDRDESALADHFPPADSTADPLDLVWRMLVYPPEKRMKAADALKHPWLEEGDALHDDGNPQGQWIEQILTL